MSAIAVNTAARPPLWRRLIGFNLLTGIIGAALGYLLGHWIGTLIEAHSINYYSLTAGQNP